MIGLFRVNNRKNYQKFENDFEEHTLGSDEFKDLTEDFLDLLNYKLFDGSIYWDSELAVILYSVVFGVKTLTIHPCSKARELRPFLTTRSAYCRQYQMNLWHRVCFYEKGCITLQV